jgi:hypothetical protein
VPLSFIKIASKGGQPQDKFFVRSGNSSQELTGDEAQSYIKEHFV